MQRATPALAEVALLQRRQALSTLHTYAHIPSFTPWYGLARPRLRVLALSPALRRRGRRDAARLQRGVVLHRRTALLVDRTAPHRAPRRLGTVLAVGGRRRDARIRGLAGPVLFPGRGAALLRAGSDRSCQQAGGNGQNELAPHRHPLGLFTRATVNQRGNARFLSSR